MAKKYKPLDYDIDNDIDDIGLDEFDVTDTCGAANAQKGRALYDRGAVIQRSFDGKAIHATIQDGVSNIPVVLDLADFSASCSDQKHLRQGHLLCEHIAALMHAYVVEPDTFLPQNIGGFIDLLNKNPQARDQMASHPEFKQILAQLQNAPPDLRAAIQNLPLKPSPEQIAALAPPSSSDELKSLLRELSLTQLREIAKRRGWIIADNAKEPLVDQLAALLGDAPLPADFSPEEEQLLRIENTLFGFDRTESAQTLADLWRARVGGDMARLDRVTRGLLSAGVMFPCTREGAALHYHWSPLLRSAELPLLATKAKLYPTEKIDRLTQAEPVLPLTAIADAIIELAEQEPLRLRLHPRDPRWANQPFAQDWDLDPKEMEDYAKTRFFANNVLTIPDLQFWSDDTLAKLEALGPDMAKWVATTLYSLGILKRDGESARVDQPQDWLAHSEHDRLELVWNGWHAGAVGLVELRLATEHASLAVQRNAYAQDFQSRHLLEEMGRARAFVTRLLAPLDPLTWYSFKSFAEYARGLRPDFLHTFTNQQTWFLIASKTRHRFEPNNTQHWDSAYRPVLATILSTTLRWFGVTEVAYEGKELAAFRITPLGASLLSGGTLSVPSEPVDAHAPAIAWLDPSASSGQAFTIRLRATPDAARAMPLVRAFADTGRAALTFQVTNASITRAFERGMTVAEITDQFAALGAPLPAALHERLDALSANYGRAHLYEQLTVIELADDFALRELLASTTLSRWVVHQFSPRLVVVRDQGVDEWVNEIVKKGYTPRVTTNEPISQ